MYQTQTYQLGSWNMITPVVKRLIIINVAVFVVDWLLGMMSGFNLHAWFGLRPAMVVQTAAVWQFFTYMFLHGGFWHIFFNMFVLWMFGNELERAWGSREFLFYYLVTGVGAGVFYFIFNLSSPIPTVGASGAIYGLLAAYGILFPNRIIYLYMLFPIPAKYFVILLGGIAFFSSVGSSSSGVAHLAHLGGMVIGYVLLKFHIRADRVLQTVQDKREQRKMRIVYKREQNDQHMRDEVDVILDKMHRVGFEGLTADEKKLLQRASEHLSREDS
jgi:membrane associated rhomboid family serine protease